MNEKSIPTWDLGQYQPEYHSEDFKFLHGLAEGLHRFAELHLGTKQGPQLQLSQPTDKNSLEAKVVPWGSAACATMPCSYRTALWWLLQVQWAGGHWAETQWGSFIKYYTQSTYQWSNLHPGGVEGMQPFLARFTHVEDKVQWRGKINHHVSTPLWWKRRCSKDMGSYPSLISFTFH